MDAPLFDTLTKTVGQRRGRRHVLAALLGAALLGPGGDAAAAKRGKGRAKRRGRFTSQSNKACAAGCKALFSSKKDRGRCIAQAAQIAKGVPADGPCPCCRYSSSSIPNAEASEAQTVCGARMTPDCEASCVWDDHCDQAAGERCLFRYTDQTTGITTFMDGHCNAPDGESVCVRVTPCPQP